MMVDLNNINHLRHILLHTVYLFTFGKHYCIPIMKENILIKYNIKLVKNDIRRTHHSRELLKGQVFAQMSTRMYACMYVCIYKLNETIIILKIALYFFTIRVLVSIIMYGVFNTFDHLKLIQYMGFVLIL